MNGASRDWRDNVQRGFNWFQPGDTGRGSGASVPCLEDAGISSIYHIAKFWGLAAPGFRLFQ